MKVSESWLREWVNPALSTEELVARVTMAGLEVDAVLPVAGSFSGVVVGEIISVEQHPDADKLRVCQVAGGLDGLSQVVCGAPNACVGLKVPFALVGALLPEGIKIKRAKLRGVESLGMLCGQDELGVGEDKNGLWELPGDALVGSDLRDYLALDDSIIELDLTPNRSDCLSVVGIARELGAITCTPVEREKITESAVQIDTQINVSLKAKGACPRYVGRVIEGIDNYTSTPLWMVEKLRRSGIRSIDPVVDVTNYVLIELGQPMHAFDKHKLSGDIHVRFACESEEIVLLNEQTIKLNSDTLVIADDRKALAMAGIMGGLESSVSSSTIDVFLESAYFDPLVIAGKARSYGLHTDSSHRFERGVDYQLQHRAIERASELLLSIVGGQAGPISEYVCDTDLPSTKKVTLSRKRLSSTLGLSAQELDASALLQRLGLKQLESDKHSWTFEVPSYRFDISIDADLIEEIARVYGYERLPTRVPKSAMNLAEQSETSLKASSLSDHLVARGFNEIIAYSFIDPKLHELFFKGQAAIELRNPISSDMAIMRMSLLPGLVETLKSNLKRQKERVRIFETGLTFASAEHKTKDKLRYPQKKSIAGLIYGKRVPVAWNHDGADVDFYDIKGEVENVLSITGNRHSYSFETAQTDAPSYFHPGQAAVIKFNGIKQGYVGALHPSLLKLLGLNKPAFVFELELDSVLLAANKPQFTPVSKFPAVTRDLAVVVNRSTTAQAIIDIIKSTTQNMLKELSVFDQYMGEGIEKHQKSLAFSLTFQDNSRTLNDEEVLDTMNTIVARLEAELGAKQR